MKNRKTKDRILLSALSLFAKKGFDATSVADIGEAVGLTKSALYKHYENKAAIFDAILARMETQDGEEAKSYSLPVLPHNESEEVIAAYRSAKLSDILGFSLEMLRYWTEDEFASAFRRMLTVEQFRSERMAALFRQFLSSGPIGYLSDLFGALGSPSPELDAMIAFAPMTQCFSLYDGAEDKAATLREGEESLKKIYAILEKQEWKN